ncbi:MULTISPECIES: prepilin peptidase [Ralstonia]|jgi:leader peptidase (prepilin peptidase)/N-methyltransferase|uniref:Prepilin signal peptidase PulO-like peptidase n=2 Tax=Ralstonia pickettii TaxID=329 RepID=R0DWF0_RALPI|nr:A24 family peptidase [Ralstonia pickettii]ENZ77748.1 prepilin signal peptidase PulO-like peptidase [Ralstonia pickettii OR214]
MEHAVVVGAVLFGLVAGGCSIVLAGWLPRFLEAQWSVDEERVGEGLGTFLATLSRMKPGSTRVSPATVIACCAFLAGAGLLGALRWDSPTSVGLFVLYASMLTTAALVDAEHQIIPDVIVFPLLWGGLLINCAGTFAPLQSAVIGAVTGYCALGGLNFLFQLAAGQSGMYKGDFKMFAAIGAWGGSQTLVTVLSGALLLFSVVTGIRMLARSDGHRETPFGPYLAVAGVVVLVLGDSARLFPNLLP